MSERIPTLLEWDTQFFGVRIGRATPSDLDAARWQKLLAEARAMDLRCLYVLREDSDLLTGRTLEQAGHPVLDERRTFVCELPSSVAVPSIAVRPAQEADLPELERISAAAYTDSRFWMDPHFSRERCAQLYRIWIERSVRETAQAVLVSELEHRPVGSVTVHLHPTHAQIGLIAVDEAARGRGIARALMLGAMRFALQAGRQRMEVVTQGRNLAAQHLYQSLGFQLTRVQCWHHVWLEPSTG